MTHQTDTELLNTIRQLLSEQGTLGFAEGMRLLVNEGMRRERSAALQAQPYERSESRQGQANGFKPKTLTTRMGDITFQVPQVRPGLHFYPSALEKGVRSEQALKLALAEMYVQGVSTRKVAAIVEELGGSSLSSTQVSQCAAKLDVELAAWRNRPLGAFPYLLIDARYEKVRHGGCLVDCAILIALGVDEQGKRTILGVSVALSEAEAHWREFLSGLQQRGLQGVAYIVSDDHAGLGAARTAVFPSVPWQRCQFHLQQNAQAYVPRMDLRPQVAADIRSIFNSPDRPAAQLRLKQICSRYAQTAPKLAAWMEENLPQGFTVFALPLAHQRKLRTANALERVNQELKRRTRVARVFPNEASVLRLITALLVEISEEWETGKIYLNMKSPTQPSA
ncbi:MAG: IS256 family transposase [Candidatus Binatia bacterium]